MHGWEILLSIKMVQRCVRCIHNNSTQLTGSSEKKHQPKNGNQWSLSTRLCKCTVYTFRAAGCCFFADNLITLSIACKELLKNASISWDFVGSNKLINKCEMYARKQEGVPALPTFRTFPVRFFAFDGPKCDWACVRKCLLQRLPSDLNFIFFSYYFSFRFIEQMKMTSIS